MASLATELSGSALGIPPCGRYDGQGFIQPGRCDPWGERGKLRTTEVRP